MKNINNIKNIGVLITVLLLSVTLAACGGNSGSSPNAFPTIAPNPAAKLPTGTAGPVAGAQVVFPQDEAPHNDLTEWWYYTGHLNAADGRKYGFEFVIFQSLQSDFPAGYASHFAITDLNDQKFNFDQKQEITSTKPKFGGNAGFNLQVGGWKLQGLNGNDHIQANMSDGKYGLDINLKDLKGVALHGGGEFSYGPSGASYYYSRPLMSLNGTLQVNGQAVAVNGQAWFDHQWGNFVSLAGGWEWFSTQLADQSEIMLYYLRDYNGNLVQAFGSYMPPCSITNPCDPAADKPIKTIELNQQDFDITPTSQWVSPASGITYPGSWHVSIKPKTDVPALDLNYQPVLKNQELDTRQSTGVSYWEGDTAVTGTVSGVGYVELTGYTKK